MSNEKTNENHALFWYVIQSTCGFHLCFHWVSKVKHVLNLAIFISYQTYELFMSFTSCHHNLKYDNFKFLFRRGLHVQHAFFLLNSSNQILSSWRVRRVAVVDARACFCMLHQCVHYDWSVSRIVLNGEIRSQIMRKIHDVITRAICLMRSTKL